MRKFILCFAILSMAIAMTMVSAVSCNRDDQQTIETKTNPFDFVGEMHNEGLDYVLGSLSLTKTESDIIEDIESLTNAFCEKVFAEDDRFYLDPTTKSSTKATSEDSEDITLSKEAIQYYNRIISITETSDHDYIKRQFEIIEKEILCNNQKKLTEYDEVFLLCSIAVGKYSNDYWQEKIATTKGLGATILLGDLIGAGKGIAQNAMIIVVSAVGGVGSVLITAARSALGPAIIGSAEAAAFYVVAEI